MLILIPRHTLCVLLIGYLLLSVPGTTNSKTPIPEPSANRADDLRTRIEQLEEQLDDLRERLNTLKKQRRDRAIPGKTLSEIKVTPESTRIILRPDQSGWAANQVFTPHVARIGDELYLLFGTQQNNPGKTGIGYTRLSENGLRLHHDKKKLVVKNRYERVSSPEYWHGADHETTTGTLYATDYYVTRIGQWGRYITRRTIRNEGNRLSVGAPQTVLTGSDKRGHWMARAVSSPNIATHNGEQTLFFRAKTWPKKSNDRLHTLGSFPLGHPERISKPLPDPRTKKTIWRDRIRGLEPVVIGDDKTLMLVSYYQPDSINVGLDAVLYRNGKPVGRERLLNETDLRPHLPRAFYSSDQSVRIGKGLELTVINDTTYLYVPLHFENKKQLIFRLNISLPETIKDNVKSP